VLASLFDGLLDSDSSRRECSRARMKSPAVSWKSVALTFVGAVIFYALAWSWLNKWHTGKGPWEVKFSTNSAGVPQLVIAQPVLGLSNITVLFEGETLAATNGTGFIAFDKPKTATPFGRVIYDDLMSQPGSVAVDCFGHVVEMIPSALILNSISNGWRNDSIHSLFPTNKLPVEVRKKWKGGYR
jgi:hypothetical protein